MPKSETSREKLRAKPDAREYEIGIGPAMLTNELALYAHLSRGLEASHLGEINHESPESQKWKTSHTCEMRVGASLYDNQAWRVNVAEYSNPLYSVKRYCAAAGQRNIYIMKYMQWRPYIIKYEVA